MEHSNTQDTIQSLDITTIAQPDIPESRFPTEILQELLKDHSTGQNIIWATDDYAARGKGYGFHDCIEVPLITGENEGIIKPRSEKAKAVQQARSRQKAEVFTPSWVCNKQNNLIDTAWFGENNLFNTEDGHLWHTRRTPIPFSNEEGKTWRDYIKDIRMEITCGEAPYLTSRYDTVTGEWIAPLDRIGLLDRKFRVVLENNGKERNAQKWYKWMKIALQATYGYEWQGDNLLLARENILSSYVRFYMLRFGVNKFPPEKILREAIDVITWNIWQMDGLKGVVPDTCVAKAKEELQMDLFADNRPRQTIPCPACLNGGLSNMKQHTGIHCRIKDWDLPHDGRNKKELFYYETLK